MIPLYELAMVRGWRCEICGFGTYDLQRHHCLVHRMKGKPELDDERNLQIVCSACHQKRANSRENRCNFWKIQLKRYPDLEDWYNGLPIKVKERFDN